MCELKFRNSHFKIKDDFEDKNNLFSSRSLKAIRRSNNFIN